MNGTGLFGSAILEVAIGLFFVYLVLSMICSSVNELLASLLKWRAQNLEDAVRNLILDKATRDALMTHPLVAALGSNRGRPKEGWNWPGTKGYGRPSYIPSRIFATALLDSLTPGSGAVVSVGAIHARARTLAAGSPDERQVGTAVAALIGVSRDPARLAQEIDAVTAAIEKLPPPADPAELQQFQQLVMALPPIRTLDELKATTERLLPAGSESRRLVSEALNFATDRLLDVECDLTLLHQNVAKWFDDAMERASGVYKRWTQLCLISIALLVCGGFGADSLRIVSVLSVNSSLRAALVQQATTQAGQSGPSPAAVSSLVGDLTPYSDLFGFSDMPVVATSQKPSDGLLHFESQALDSAWKRWLAFKVIGIIATVCAVSQGAPFWFDLLGKVANLRGAGNPPPTSADRK